MVDKPVTFSVVLVRIVPLDVERVATAFEAGSSPTVVSIVRAVTVASMAVG